MDNLVITAVPDLKKDRMSYVTKLCEQASSALCWTRGGQYVVLSRLNARKGFGASRMTNQDLQEGDPTSRLEIWQGATLFAL